MTRLKDLAASGPNVVPVSPTATVRDAAKAMAAANTSASMIMDGEKNGRHRHGA